MAAVAKSIFHSEMPKSGHCPACGNSAQQARHAWKFVNARGQTEWLRCSHCHSYFMDGEYCLENEVEHTQKMTWGDAEHGAELNFFKQRMYQSILKQLIQQMPAVGKRLLDVGCAYGGFMKAAQDAGFDVAGFDIVPAAVSHVQKQGMIAQCCARVRDFEPVQKPFDAVSVLDANIYWPHQPAELKDIHDRLAPGGILVMRIVDKSWMAGVGAMLQQVSQSRGQKLLQRAVNDHRFSMPARSFLRVLETAGFRVISASPRGAMHSDDTSLAVKLSFGLGIALWQTLGVFLAPGAVILAEKSVDQPD